MQILQTYLFFNGNCREAMEFYAALLEGKLEITTYGQSPAECPEGAQDRIMHANISTNGDSMLMASDTPPQKPLQEATTLTWRSTAPVANSRTASSLL